LREWVGWRQKKWGMGGDGNEFVSQCSSLFSQSQGGDFTIRSVTVGEQDDFKSNVPISIKFQ